MITNNECNPVYWTGLYSYECSLHTRSEKKVPGNKVLLEAAFKKTIFLGNTYLKVNPKSKFPNPKSKIIFAAIMSKSTDELFKNVISHAKEYGFVFPSSEIYDGLSAVYDYGQNGAELKNNIKTYWWKAMVQMNDNIVGIDSAIFMHPKIWKASGHVDGFSDPMIDNKDSKKRYRADQLLEDKIAKYDSEGKTDKLNNYSMTWTRP